MIRLHLQTILERDLLKLKEELHQYSSPGTIWVVAPGISNCAGNLSLHIAGNLRHFIGAVLGKTGYVRDRDLEFTQKDVTLAQLDALIDTTIAEVTNTLKQLDPAILTSEFPKEVGGLKRDTLFVLLHLMSHLSYHLGQINYHRRIVSSLEM
jgi:Protein of unknown function (DUF1572)